MRILSWRLIVALVVGVTLVSVASSWYEVRSQKDALRNDLERKAATLGESLASTAQLYLQAGDRDGLEDIVERVRWGDIDRLQCNKRVDVCDKTC